MYMYVCADVEICLHVWMYYLQGIEPNKSGQVGVASNEAEQRDEDGEWDKRRVQELHNGEQRHKRQGCERKLFKHVASPLETVR